MTTTRRGFFARMLGVLAAPFVAKVAESNPFDKIEPVHRPLYDGENPWAGLAPPKTMTEIMMREADAVERAGLPSSQQRPGFTYVGPCDANPALTNILDKMHKAQQRLSQARGRQVFYQRPGSPTWQEFRDACEDT